MKQHQQRKLANQIPKSVNYTKTLTRSRGHNRRVCSKSRSATRHHRSCPRARSQTPPVYRCFESCLQTAANLPTLHRKQMELDKTISSNSATHTQQSAFFARHNSPAAHSEAPKTVAQNNDTTGNDSFMLKHVGETRLQLQGAICLQNKLGETRF